MPIPGPGQDTTLTAMALLGQRAKSLYANFQYSLGSPAENGPVLAVRPLVELVILVKWITLDPELHMFLYVADSDAAAGPNEWEWVGDKSPTSMYAYVLETVFAAIGDDDNAPFARKLRDFVFLKFVRSDRVQPPSDKPDAGEDA